MCNVMWSTKLGMNSDVQQMQNRLSFLLIVDLTGDLSMSWEREHLETIRIISIVH